MVAACEADAVSGALAAFATAGAAPAGTTVGVTAAATACVSAFAGALRWATCQAPKPAALIRNSAPISIGARERRPVPGGVAGGTTRPSRFARMREPPGCVPGTLAGVSARRLGGALGVELSGALIHCLVGIVLIALIELSLFHRNNTWRPNFGQR